MALLGETRFQVAARTDWILRLADSWNEVEERSEIWRKTWPRYAVGCLRYFSTNKIYWTKIFSTFKVCLIDAWSLVFRTIARGVVKNNTRLEVSFCGVTRSLMRNAK